MTPLRRFLVINSTACAAAAALWAAIVVVYVKFGSLPALAPIYRTTLILWLICLPLINAVAFRKAPNHAWSRAIVAAVFLALALAYFGVVEMMEIKVVLGGAK